MLDDMKQFPGAFSRATKRCCRASTRLCTRLLSALIVLCGVTAVQAHPHAFVEGGVDFVVGSRADQITLDALQVTWLLDEFETLYMISAAELGLNEEGELDDEDNAEFQQQMHVWLSDFSGSAHASADGNEIPLHKAVDIVVALVDGRLKVTFERALVEPLPMAGREIEVAFYEASYFYAHMVTQPSLVHGTPSQCKTHTIPFDPDKQASAVQASLQRLAREENPDDVNVGALFADRIVMQCA